MHGAVVLDRSDRPVRPAILHNDGRAHRRGARNLHAIIPRSPDIVGVKPMPGFTGPKLLWLTRHEPDNCARGSTACSRRRTICASGSCGERGTDMSDAAGTWMLDEAARAWSAEAIAACGAERAWAPPLFEGSAAVGTIRPGVADELGLPRGVVIAAGRRRRGGRRGRTRRDRAGRGLHFARHGDAAHRRDRPLSQRAGEARPQLRPCAARPLVRDGGDAERRRRARLRRAPARHAPDTLEREAADGYRGPGALVFLPYLSGERTPLDDPYARGVLFGMSETTSPRRCRPRGDGGRRADARRCARLPRRGRRERSNASASSAAARRARCGRG